MKLRAWRELWMSLAVGACGGTAPAWMTQPPVAKVSVFDAPPLANATYLATTRQEERLPREIAIERGRFECRGLFSRLLASDRVDDDDPALKTCDVKTATLLRDGDGFVFVDAGDGGRWLSKDDVIKAAVPIDSPAKALLVAWVHGEYELGWSDGKHAYGTLEDGRVRAVPGGFEVVASISVPRIERCVTGTVRAYRVTLFVDTAGGRTERDRTKIRETKFPHEECHPLGRRPADFVDVTGDYLARAMHHEAESVRAFLRIARELRAYAAPAELVLATEQAALDERDHAERCAALLGTHATVGADELPVRTLRTFAIDNVVEGCVGEAYAALSAVVQASSASTPALRAHFAAIALDELAHAALAHAIADWIDTVVSDDDRVAIAAARDEAIADLERAGGASPEIVQTFGAPSGADARRLLATIREVATR